MNKFQKIIEEIGREVIIVPMSFEQSSTFQSMFMDCHNAFEKGLHVGYVFSREFTMALSYGEGAPVCEGSTRLSLEEFMQRFKHIINSPINE